MRVLHVFKDYFPPTYGGIEQHVHELVHSLEGVSCCVLTSSGSRHRTSNHDDGVPVVGSAEYGRPFSTPITPGWLRLLRRLQPDLIHLHMPSPFGELALLACRTRVPLVPSYHVGKELSPRDLRAASNEGARAGASAGVGRAARTRLAAAGPEPCAFARSEERPGVRAAY